MNVKFIDLVDRDTGENCGFQIEIDGKYFFSITEGEPEDMTMDRSLNDVYNLPSIIERIYNAVINKDTVNFSRELVEY